MKNAAGHSNCLDETVRELQAPIQTPFHKHFLDQAQDIVQRYTSQATSLTDPAVAKALGFLKPVSAWSVTTTTLKKMSDDLTSAYDQIRETEPPPSAGSGPVQTWFKGLEDDVRAEINELSNAAAAASEPKDQSAFNRLDNIQDTLRSKGARGKPAELTLANIFSEGSDAVPQSLVALQPELGGALFEGWKKNTVEKEAPEVYAFRVKAAVFGHNSPGTLPATTRTFPSGVETFTLAPGKDFDRPTNPGEIYLDAAYDRILPGSWIVIQRPFSVDVASPRPDLGRTRFITAKAGNPNAGLSLKQFGVTSKATYLTLIDAEPAGWMVAGDDFNIVRDTAVYAQSELLPLAEAPIDCPVGHFQSDKFPGCQLAPGVLELNGAFDGIQP